MLESHFESTLRNDFQTIIKTEAFIECPTLAAHDHH